MKKFISVLVCIILTVNFLAVPTYALTLEEPVYVFCGEEHIDWSYSQEINSEYMSSYFYNNSGHNQIYNAYSLLNDLEREYYDTVVNIAPGTLSFVIEYSPNLTASQFNSIDFTKIMHAICLDHPELFYYNGYSCSKSYYPTSGIVVSVTYNIKTKTNPQTNEPVYTSENISSYNEALKKAFKNVNVDTSNRYFFVKSVHDYLCNTVTYVNDYSSCHDVYGTLVNKEAVCQGYAETMKMFCNYYKIPCVCLTGTGNGGPHMWNAVQMDDGLWYYLDITWDDQDSVGIFDDFFLVGANTKDTYFGGEAFNVSHLSDGSPYLPVLNYATEEYSETEHNTAFEATYNSITKEGNYLIRSFFDVEESFVYYNGMYVDTNGLTTGAEFEVPSGENKTEENWSLVLLGDCTGDGECNYLDYSDAVNRVLSDRDVLTAYDMASDIDCDGYLDVIDLALINIIVNRLDTDINVE